MKLFAKKASTEPSLPPELQPYYGRPSRWVWWRNMGPRSRGAVLLAAAVVLALIGLLVWVATKDTATTTKPGSGNPAASQSPQNNKSLDTDRGQPATTPLSGETIKAKPAE
jgi:hypothetical protein